MNVSSCQVSLAQQNYLETVYELCEKHGHAHSKDIAEHLNVRMASVTEAIQSLAGMGLVNYRQRQAVTLTAKGLKMARELASRHAVLANFYRRILGCTEDRADEFACRVEHVVDAEFIARLQRVSTLLCDAMERHGADSIMELPELSATREK